MDSDPSSFVISHFESFSKVISPDAFGLGLFPSAPPVTPESPPPYGVLEFEPSNDNEVWIVDEKLSNDVFAYDVGL